MTVFRGPEVKNIDSLDNCALPVKTLKPATMRSRQQQPQPPTMFWPHGRLRTPCSNPPPRKRSLQSQPSIVQPYYS